MTDDAISPRGGETLSVERPSNEPRQDRGVRFLEFERPKLNVKRWPASGRPSTYIPGKPPRPFMASIWRIIFFAPPPFIIFIIFCICWNCFSS